MAYEQAQPDSKNPGASRHYFGLSDAAKKLPYLVQLSLQNERELILSTLGDPTAMFGTFGVTMPPPASANGAASSSHAHSSTQAGSSSTSTPAGASCGTNPVSSKGTSNSTNAGTGGTSSSSSGGRNSGSGLAAGFLSRAGNRKATTGGQEAPAASKVPSSSGAGHISSQSRLPGRTPGTHMANAGSSTAQGMPRSER